MYSVVLAVALTTSTATPDWGFGFGCHGCHGCTGCCGNAFSCHGCCGGCYGCCGGCYGCCGGCYGCCGGCYGSGSFSWAGREWTGFSATTNYNFYNCGGCNGCYGCAGYFPAPVSVPRTAAVVGMADQNVGNAIHVDRRVETIERTAQVTVVMPENARLFVDDVPYPTIQEKITFETPKLEANRTFYYTLKAEVVRDGKVYRDSRRVDVAAGKEVKVEFGSLPPLQAAQR